MVFCTNGQNESFSADSSGCSSDSDGNRFYRKNINSQREQSSSTSASSSHSEPEQVSSRPAAENLAPSPSPIKNPAPPAPKKIPAADSSDGRDQGTPFPKAHSASKPKRVAAGKRSKDDDSSEEQPEPKKKSASKGNKPVEEEAGPSSPMKMGLRKQHQESAAVIAQATPSGKDSLQKSSRKTAPVWTDNEETVIMHGYLVCLKEGLEFPKNIPQLIERIKDSLAHETSKSQMYEKLRRMKGRYESIKNTMVEGNIKEAVFSYRTLHEKELYHLWKRAWEAQPEEDDMEVDPAGDALEVNLNEVVGDDRCRAGKDCITAGDHDEEEEEEEEDEEEEEEQQEQEEGEEVESDAGTNTVKIPKALKSTTALDSNRVSDNALVSLMPMSNDKPENMLGYEACLNEIMDMLAEVTRDVKKTIDNSIARTMTLLERHLGSTNGTRCTGRNVNSAAWLRNMESDLEGFYSIREIPVVDEARLEAIEGKWRDLLIRELEVSSQRFVLLQEECSMQIEALKAMP